MEWIANAISYVPLAAKNHRWLPARRASSRAAAIFNAGRTDLRALSYVAESDGLVTATADGLRAAGEVPPAPSTPAERLSLWCGRLPSPALEMLRTLAAQGEHFMDADELAAALGKKPTGGHWNSGIAVLRNNGLIETDGRPYRTTTLFCEYTVYRTEARKPASAGLF